MDTTATFGVVAPRAQPFPGLSFRVRLESSEDSRMEEAQPSWRLKLNCSVNGGTISAEVEARTTLLDFLRDRLHLTGTKKGCSEGACGTCTVLIDGKRMNACLTLAVQCEGREVTTIEGVGAVDALHPVQQAFITHDAFQCGYCTPGQILSAIACIAEGHATNHDSVREWMSGNICRCSAYPQITAAVLEAAQEMEVLRDA